MFVFIFTRFLQTFWDAEAWHQGKITQGCINTNSKLFQNVFLVDLSKNHL